MKREKILSEFEQMQKNPAKYIIPGKAHVLAMCPEKEIINRGTVEV